MKNLFFFLTSLWTLSVFAQDDSVMVKIAADTLGREMQEGGISVEALNLYNRALAFAGEGQADSAIVYFTDALDINPDFGKALYNRSAAFVRMGNYPSALSDIDRYLEVVDTAKVGYFSRAEILDELKRTDDAIAAYKRAIEKEDKVKESYFSIAKLYLRKEEYQSAIDNFTANLRYDPSNANALHDRGSAYHLSGDLTAAERDYRQATMVSDGFARAYANLGTVLRKQERYKEAIDAYSQALAIESKDPLVLNNRGYAYYLNEDYDNAVSDFQKAIELDDTYAYAHNNLASAYIRLEEFEKAVESASRAINLDPEYGFAYLNRGIAREMVRDVTGACRDWEKAEAMKVKGAAEYRAAICKYIEP